MMDAHTAPSASSYTILRIKRKRTDEPLDALVVEQSKRRKSKGGVGVFHFAETVEEEAWRDEKAADDLRSRITTLAKEAPVAATKSLSPTCTTAPRNLSRDNASSRRYTVVMQNGSQVEPPPSAKYPQSPPKVISAKDIATPKSNFTIYDAVLTPNLAPNPPDPEMEKFQSLLQDYFKLEDTAVHSQSPVQAAAPIRPSVKRVGGSGEATPRPLSGGDYVWDVFYHRPAVIPSWADVANIATLTGLPPSLNYPFDSDSDSEPEDEDDQDSNAEDFYKNDYPDEEDPESESSEGSDDASHEDSDDESNDPQDRFDPNEWR